MLIHCDVDSVVVLRYNAGQRASVGHGGGAAEGNWIHLPEIQNIKQEPMYIIYIYRTYLGAKRA